MSGKEEIISAMEQFEKAMDAYKAAITAYHARVVRFTVEQTDCPGKPIPAAKLTDLHLSATLCEGLPRR